MSQPICTLSNGGGEPQQQIVPQQQAGGMQMMEEPTQKRQRPDDGSEDMGESHAPVSVTAMAEDDSAMNLESSLQSCTAHRERILQVLARQPVY